MLNITMSYIFTIGCIFALYRQIPIQTKYSEKIFILHALWGAYNFISILVIICVASNTIREVEISSNRVARYGEMVHFNRCFLI